ncbi:hypothetical protein G6Z27_13405 [Clostridium perfringens]|nr:hypothetical protein [Clostridium perfringens]
MVLKYHKRKESDRNFRVINITNMTAVLVEFGFIINP